MGGEERGLVNVKYLKIINKTFPPDDKDPTACSSALSKNEDKREKFPVSSARIHQNCINKQSERGLCWFQSYQVSAINNNPPLKAFNHLNVSLWMEARAPDWSIYKCEILNWNRNDHKQVQRLEKERYWTATPPI